MIAKLLVKQLKINQQQSEYSVFRAIFLIKNTEKKTMVKYYLITLPYYLIRFI